MKKIALFLLLLFALIGIWKFSNKIDLNSAKESFRSSKKDKKEEGSKLPSESEVQKEVVESVHVIYNYLPDQKLGDLVEHKYYTLSYNEQYEQAEWVAYKLNTTFLKGNAKRARSFYKDKLVITQSAHKDDYKYSGYDRGHLLPAADRKITKEAMKETFYMSNISPQSPGLNRKAWKYLEEQIRVKAYSYDSLYIITGPIIEKEYEKLGANQVAVPSAFYKVVLNYTNTSALCATAFIFPNKAVKNITDQYIVTIDSVEAVTGIDFFAQLPIELQHDFESKDCLLLFD